MSKIRIIDKNSERAVRFERELLTYLRHPFIVNMIYSFQDYDNLYLIIDYLNGGDLRFHMCRTRRNLGFTEIETRFFIGCLILALEYIHSNNIIHRDIKPENLIFEKIGYLRITDFGIAKIYRKDNHNDTSGTPGYMSPEVIQCQNHTKAVDYYAIGIIGYELMMGRRPYNGKNRIDIREQILSFQAKINDYDLPKNWSKNSADFINNLLIRKPEKRLGFKSIEELKNHSWFDNFNWNDLSNKKMESPFIPPETDNYDKKYCNSVEQEDAATKERYEKIIKGKLNENAFINFTYYPLADNSNKIIKYNHHIIKKLNIPLHKRNISTELNYKLIENSILNERNNKKSKIFDKKNKNNKLIDYSLKYFNQRDSNKLYNRNNYLELISYRLNGNNTNYIDNKTNMSNNIIIKPKNNSENKTKHINNKKNNIVEKISTEKSMDLAKNNLKKKNSQIKKRRFNSYNGKFMNQIDIVNINNNNTNNKVVNERKILNKKNKINN